MKVTKFKVTQTPTSLGVSAHAVVPTIFAGVIGKPSLDIEARAEVPLGLMALEIALVLDNTGSMSRLGKMDALKQAAKSLIDTVQSAAGSSSSSFALVPFNTQVNVGEGNRYASWLRFSPGGMEPKLDVTQAAWTGCVVDRDQNEDVKPTLPNTAKPETLYPAASCQYANLKAIMPLSRDFPGMKSAIDLMVPTGNTNTGIGLAWGLAALTPGAPLSGIARAPGPRIQKTIVFLTDGLNTENRWTKDAAQIDKRTEKLCDEVKANKNSPLHHPRHRGQRDDPAQLRDPALHVFLGQPSVRAEGGFRQDRRRPHDLAAVVLTAAQAAFARLPVRLSNMPRPSMPPTSGSTRFSGCGMRPSTFSFSE